MMKPIINLIIILLGLPLGIQAETYLNGSYETSFDIRRDTGSYKWQLDYPWHRLELRFFTNPLESVDFFIKTYANYDHTAYGENSQYKNQLFQLAESHVHYRIGSRDRFDIFLFAKQNRFFLGDPLLNLVNNDKDKWDYDGATDTSKVAGASLEMDGFMPGFHLKFFNAHMYEQQVDGYGLRVYDDLIKEKLRLGATTTYKKWPGGLNNYNVVVAADVWFNILKNYFTVEGAKSDTPGDYTLKENDDAFKIEYRRNLDFQALGLGAGDIDLILSAREIGEHFRAYLSKEYDNDNRYDQRGYFVETKYRPPLKAVTFTYHRDYYKKHTITYSQTDDFFESYIEFINNFNLKIWYQTLHQFNWDRIQITKLDGTTQSVYLQDDRWSHLFWELTMNDEITFVKLQFKIKNIKSEYLRYIYGSEFSINITKRLKSLNRVLVVDEIYRSRNTLWSQIQYNFGPGTDFYLEYGNDSFVNNDLVNDDDFVESDNNMEHKIHLYLKVSF
ncbi:MAG: hypothetical protein JW827_07290 [Spirochaetes bacterium]|nr:hypothetical protein [Spirochaetota bacterium]